MVVAGTRHIEEAVVGIVEDRMWIAREPGRWAIALLSLMMHRSLLV
jgi:hypothetical protein